MALKLDALTAWLRHRRMPLSIAAALIALYGAFGFWIAPGIAREQIVQQLSAALDRKVTLEAVRINPFALSVTLGKFSIEEPDGGPIVAFKELYVNFSTTSAFRFAWTFSEIRLTEPSLMAVLREDGTLNLSALGGAPPEDPAPENEAPATDLPRVVVGQLTVTEGQVGFEDRRGKQPYQTIVGAISFSLKDFSTLPDDQGLHAFSATTDLGERLAWRGRIGVNPPQSQGHVELTGIRVPRLAAYLLPGTIEVTEGLFEIGADYDVKMPPSGTELSVTGGRIALRDVRVKMGSELTPLNLELAPIALHLNGLTGRPGNRANGSLEIVPNGAGKIAVRGSFGLDPLTADLNVSVADIALAPFQTFIEPYARLKLERGALNVDGRFELTADKATTRFTGNAGISDFSAVDGARGQSFSHWRAIKIEDIRYTSTPPSLAIARITADEPYLRFIIGPDGVTNLQHILGAGTEPEPGAGKTPPAAAPALQSRIGVIAVRNGSANFADQTLKPGFTTGLQQLSGTIKGLSSRADARAAVALRGKVDRYAPSTIEGAINPLAPQAYADMALRFENIDLTTFTPYSGKFAGRRIDKGKLNLNLHYKLVDRELKGENKIVFDQLTLGERVESPEAMDLPLQLAIAILQDSRGVIDVDLPVQGNLDDPKFSYAGIVWKALVNLIRKAITAPFTLLASALGGGEELGYVVFVPGEVEIPSSEQEKLDKLARALADRPQLQLEVRGTAAADADRRALASAKIMREIRARDAVAGTPLSSAEARRLFALYRKTFGEDPKPAADTVPEAEREASQIVAAHARLTDAIPVAEEALRELAQQRGATINDYLITRGGIAKERVFPTAPNAGATSGSDGVRSELKLVAR